MALTLEFMRQLRELANKQPYYFKHETINGEKYYVLTKRDEQTMNDMNWDQEAAEEVGAGVLDASPDLAALTEVAATLKNEIATLEAETKVKQDSYKEITGRILRALDLMGLDSLKAHGYTFFKKSKTSVTTPKTVGDKVKLFEFLQERGIFDEMVSVNSMTLNSLYKSLSEEAAKEGILEFRIPGVGEPTTYTTLELRRS